MLQLKGTPVVYITRDIERATGLKLNTPDYYIISNYSDFAKRWTNNKKNILLINENEPLDTWQLLQNKKTSEFIAPLKNPNILVFKNTSQIERICEKNNWKLLNPRSTLSNKIEEKISQVKWLGNLRKYLPDTKIELCKNIVFSGKRFIVQFNRSHTGTGTILVGSDSELKKIQQIFPNRETRVTKYIEGPAFTSNNVVTKDKVLIGNISYQITGLQPFTDQKFATIGNDWGVVKKLLNKSQIDQFKRITIDVGKKLQADGWRGLFGIDAILEQKTGKLYLIEINARQPASTSYESILQKIRNPKSEIKNLTTFEAHLAALLDIDLSKYEIAKIDDGAQIISRITKHISRNNPETIKILNKQGFDVIPYNNTKPGSDLLRIQSNISIMNSHNEFNEAGQKILSLMS